MALIFFCRVSLSNELRVTGFYWVLLFFFYSSKILFEFDFVNYGLGQ